jgi:hypothetical protein
VSAFREGDRVRDTGPNCSEGVGTVQRADMTLRSKGPGPWYQVAFPSGAWVVVHEKDLVRA